MGTIVINGRRFAGNSAAVRDGKLVVDGKPQAGEVRGDIDMTVTDGATGKAQCVVSVSGDRSNGAIRAEAFASSGTGRRKATRR